MKLQTSIKPRLTGNVIAHAFGKDYVFSLDDSGCLVCEVDCEDSIELLLKTGNFFAADGEKSKFFGHFSQAPAAELPAVNQSQSNEDDDQDDDQEDHEEHLNALPVEENTPPSRKKPRKAS